MSKAGFTIGALSLLLSLTASSAAIASDSPFQDYMKHHEALKNCTSLSELVPFALSSAPGLEKMKNSTAESSKGTLTMMRSMDNWNSIKLRSEDKRGNDATLVVDTIGPEFFVTPGKVAQIKPYVLVVNMVKENDLWKLLSTNMHTVQEAIDCGITSAKALDDSREWCQLAHKVAIPNKPLSGVIEGTPFTLSSATFQNSPNQDGLTLEMAPTAKWEHATVYISFDVRPKTTAEDFSEGSGMKQVQLNIKSGSHFKTVFFRKEEGYGINMRILPRKDGNYPVYLMLRVPGAQHTELKGYFYAKDIFGK